MTRKHFGELLTLLVEDGKQVFLAENPKRVEVLINFLMLHHETGESEGKVRRNGQLLALVEKELDSWLEKLGGFGGDKNGDGQAKALTEMVRKVQGGEKADGGRVDADVEILPDLEPSQHKERAIEASKRLQLALFGDEKPVMEKGKLEFGPEILTKP